MLTPSRSSMDIIKRSDLGHRERFVLRLGYALHRHGASSQNLEDALGQVSSQLDVRAEILSTPTSMMVAFGEPGSQRITLQRVEPGGVNLGRLCELSEVAGEVARGECSIEQGLTHIEAIIEHGLTWSIPAVLMASTLASGCVARFFGASWLEMIFSALLGLLVGVMGLFAPRSVLATRLYEPLAAMCVAFLSVWVGSIWGVRVSLLMVSGLIVLVPGFTLTVAIKELATRHLVSGAARTFSAFLTFFVLGFGVFLGQRVASALFEPSILAPAVGVNSWVTELVALLIVPVALSVLFQARKRDLVAICAVGVIAYVSAKFGREMLGPELGAFLGALSVGCCGNFLSRWGDRPATAMQIPGVIMLVPGSVGFASVTAMIAQDVFTGVQVGFGMLMLATAIVAGLLCADAVIASKKVF